MYEKPLFIPSGDQSLVVELGDAITPEINRRVRNLMLAVESSALEGVIDLVPTYRSLMVYYDPMAITAEQLQINIEQADQNPENDEPADQRVVHVPTLYGGKYGPDLDFVAQHAGLTTEEVVRIHSATDYLTYMMGFSPGFPYLGGLSGKLTTPRLETPRTEIPVGSVGIAESQTGVYTVASPGGWRLIGRTPMRLFDPGADPPSLLKAGDYVRFVPMASEEEYLDVRQRVESGRFGVGVP